MPRFTVTGRGPFPGDMLRRDRCWPASADAAGQIARSYVPETWGRQTIELATQTEGWRLTPARWKSFGWEVQIDEHAL